jgi:hypothetical protein
MRGLRSALLASGAWRPAAARILVRQRGRVADRRRRVAPGRENLRAVAGWLSRAQDATGDGGVSWGYTLRRGWMPSYPETTGYIVPTLLALSDRLGDPDLENRAERAVRFLYALQLESGAFPGARVDENLTEPSVFNTGQIINGLVAWHRHSGETEALDRALRAGDWLIGVQDDDGAWRRHIYNGLAVTYTAHASSWLAELGRLARSERHLAAAVRHAEWVLSRQDADTGWFDDAGFTAADHAARRSVTHTIVYVLSGLLATADAASRDDIRDAVLRAARPMAARLAASGWLPGVLDAEWKGRAAYACLTGTAQAALLWYHLVRTAGASDLRSPARIAVELVTAAQRPEDTDPGVRGGIAGSDPVWGHYLGFTYPNWAAKFYADALIAHDPDGGA